MSDKIGEILSNLDRDFGDDSGLLGRFYDAGSNADAELHWFTPDGKSMSVFARSADEEGDVWFDIDIEHIGSLKRSIERAGVILDNGIDAGEEATFGPPVPCAIRGDVQVIVHNTPCGPLAMLRGSDDVNAMSLNLGGLDAVLKFLGKAMDTARERGL
jgi:hypothetical protein